MKRHIRRVDHTFCHIVEVRMNITHFKPGGAREWLTETFGPEFEGWVLRGPAIYGFKSEQDKMLFVLRWV